MVLIRLPQAAHTSALSSNLPAISALLQRIFTQPTQIAAIFDLRESALQVGSLKGVGQINTD
jgi:hypothetical protein